MKTGFLLFLLFGFAANSHAQKDAEPPYKKFKNVPPLKLLLPDGTSYYTKDDLPKKKAVMLMMFNPICEHCRHETVDILRNIDKFEDVQIIMATSMPFDSMMSFRQTFHLDQYPNITIGQDQKFFLITFFQLHNLPFLAFYNKKKEFISVFEGSMPIEQVIEEVKK
jgi:thiol-disulfide isomerase/thioredoxin